jgi:PAS domain S-box-containing protein
MDQQKSKVDQFIETDKLVEALKGDRFRQILDKIPIALLLATMPDDQIIYANSQFETLTGQSQATVEGKPWSVLRGRSQADDRELSQAVKDDSEHIGSFIIDRQDAEGVLASAYSNVIEDDDGVPAYRLVALIAIGTLAEAEREAWEKSLRDKDVLLQELQHRVKNNLQMITALIRLEARRWPDGHEPLSRLAGRIEALKILYQCLSEDGQAQEVNLGAYLGQVATAVMQSNATEGVRLALEVDVFPVSVNIAMPAGLIVNELMTNALKYAFAGRKEGAITLQSLPDGKTGRKIVVADNGVGLPPGVTWPQSGKLSDLIVQTLRENAAGRIEIESSPDKGTRVTLFFTVKKTS